MGCACALLNPTGPSRCAAARTLASRFFCKAIDALYDRQASVCGLPGLHGRRAAPSEGYTYIRRAAHAERVFNNKHKKFMARHAA